MNQIFDLFGDPVPANWGQKGRPEHVASQKNRNRVSMLVAAGWSNGRIAAALYITIPTLRKHYFSELSFRKTARDRLNANMMTRLWELFINDGSVAALKEFRDVMRENDRMSIEANMGAAPSKSETNAKPGKKVIDEQRATDADADLMAELESEAASQNAIH